MLVFYKIDLINESYLLFRTGLLREQGIEYGLLCGDVNISQTYYKTEDARCVFYIV